MIIMAHHMGPWYSKRGCTEVQRPGRSGSIDRTLETPGSGKNMAKTEPLVFYLWNWMGFQDPCDTLISFTCNAASMSAASQLSPDSLKYYNQGFPLKDEVLATHHDRLSVTCQRTTNRSFTRLVQRDSLGSHPPNIQNNKRVKPHCVANCEKENCWE